LPFYLHYICKGMLFFIRCLNTILFIGLGSENKLSLAQIIKGKIKHGTQTSKANNKETAESL